MEIKTKKEKEKNKMKKTITGVAAVAVLTCGMVSTGHTWGLKLSGSYSKQSSTSQSSGRDSQNFGKNSGGRDRWEIKNQGDFAQDSNNRVTNTNRTDNRDYSNRSVTSTVDSRDMSDNRDQSDRSVRDYSNRSTNIDSHDVANNQQYNQQYGDKAGGAIFKDKVDIRAGHAGAVNFGPISGGSNNVMDASINGNTFVIGNSGSN